MQCMSRTEKRKDKTAYRSVRTGQDMNKLRKGQTVRYTEGAIRKVSLAAAAATVRVKFKRERGASQDGETSWGVIASRLKRTDAFRSRNKACILNICVGHCEP